MSQSALVLSRDMLGAFTLLIGIALPASAATDVRVSENYGKFPLHFEANRGQIHKNVRFLSRGPGYSLYLIAGEAVLVLSKPNADTKRDSRSTPEQGDAQTPVKAVALRMHLVGAAPKPPVSGLDELPGKANYFIGQDPAKWRTNVPTYAKVQYENIYPGIDLLYYGNQRQLEYDFVVAPGANPEKIVLGFRGADEFEIEARGELVLHTTGGDIRQHKPIIYQDIDGVRRDIAGGYVRKGVNRVGFEVAVYDASRPLIIDPVLSYSTYLGGRSNGPDCGCGNDEAFAVAVDDDGNAYVTGQTTSLDFPTTSGAFQTTRAFGKDVFITKLNPAGSALVYSTYLGGNDFDAGNGISVDAGGNAYVTGTTKSTNFPTTPGAFLSAPGFGFVTKLDPTGSTLVYSTYLDPSTQGGGIAVDAQGNAYVTGQTGSTFPTTPGAFQPAFGGGPVDGYVMKLNADGSALVYSTYLGGSGIDSTGDIAVDAGGNAYVAGSTTSLNFPTTPGAFQPVPGSGSSNGFATNLDPTGSSLVYSTFLGEGCAGLALDTQGNVYVTGQTGSTTFPTTPGAFHPFFSGGGGPGRSDGDAFVAKIADVVPPPPPTTTGSGTTRSEESAATEIGFWTSYGAETGSFSGGTIVASNVIASTAIFSFTGTAVSWIGVKCNVCGIALVSIDGGVPTTVNTAGPNAPGSLTSESVFSASGLAATSHMITIAVAGMSSSGGRYVAVDAFDVTAGSGTSPLLPTVVLPPQLTLPPLPPLRGL